MNQELKSIADYYGLDVQARQLIEEMAELTQAITHLWRIQGGDRTIYDPDEVADPYGAQLDRIVEEMADVDILIKQLRYLLCISKGLWKEYRRYKTERQLRRIEEERDDE